jgi:hypothetical protein
VGTVTGISGNGSWASDMCMRVQAPGGATYTVGGFSGVQPGCNVNDWDFDGAGSDPDGTYSSSHDGVFASVEDTGDWIFTFSNDWNSASAGTMNWSNVTVTLLKEPLPICDDVTLVPWLSVDPTSGITTVGQTSPVDVEVDATGLAEGDYEAVLCVETNDPAAPLVVVPVSLTVAGEPDPVIFIDGFESGNAGAWTLCQGCT